MRKWLEINKKSPAVKKLEEQTSTSDQKVRTQDTYRGSFRLTLLEISAPVSVLTVKSGSMSPTLRALTVRARRAGAVTLPVAPATRDMVTLLLICMTGLGMMWRKAISAKIDHEEQLILEQRQSHTRHQPGRYAPQLAPGPHFQPEHLHTSYAELQCTHVNLCVAVEQGLTASETGSQWWCTVALFLPARFYAQRALGPIYWALPRAPYVRTPQMPLRIDFLQRPSLRSMELSLQRAMAGLHCAPNVLPAPFRYAQPHSPTNSARRASHSHQPSTVCPSVAEQSGKSSGASSNSLSGTGSKKTAKVSARGTTFQSELGRKLRSAMLEAGVTPHNSRSKLINCRGLGTCGTCAVRLEGPVLPTQWTTAEQLRLSFPPHSAPANQKLRLACQVTVQGDLQVNIVTVVPVHERDPEVTKMAGFWGSSADAESQETASDFDAPFGKLEYLLDSTKKRDEGQK
eukprot:gene14989-21047_t